MFLPPQIDYDNDVTIRFANGETTLQKYMDDDSLHDDPASSFFLAKFDASHQGASASHYALTMSEKVLESKQTHGGSRATCEALPAVSPSASAITTTVNMQRSLLMSSSGRKERSKSPSTTALPAVASGLRSPQSHLLSVPGAAFHSHRVSTTSPQQHRHGLDASFSLRNGSISWGEDSFANHSNTSHHSLVGDVAMALRDTHCGSHTRRSISRSPSRGY